LFRVISLNANDIRAAARKGFFDWMAVQNADVVCIQETKAQVHQLTDELFSPTSYHCYYENAEKKGYSGTAIYTRHKPKKVIRGYGDPESDNEGRYLEVQLGGINVVSLYLPSGSSGDVRQEAKYRYTDAFRTLEQKPEQYTWWTNRGRTWDNNVGWRLDYHALTPGLKDKALSSAIYREERFSDHAPITVDSDWTGAA
jgi:exodeoxyribonuclease-3